ncbi:MULTISPECIES: FxsB family cyclophane-forming radical SAM/SPASM peptide maturase [Streptomyces]|uniref:FxsB family cyclophane-forming radical SAM/SPASM peptide maturase n=1 Tax=Streptomyces solicathayae TaxID=3081768 RepID=A0ABZ0M2N3_9ACTN|nr:FxsB family cyclophane-forming radical SAM/SPASM peptide maturase [Streptomyces sp. HUAS YS2]WOX26033.1 FxsB family cyclophane-forming radical SAM/SPASM peptide maturase [Streptomyces sp. HUAS YS2]
MGHPSLTLTQFVVKVHSRCDLACDHCYVYEHADTSWRGRPRTPSRAILARTAQRIAEHARTHGLSTVHVVLHGGEPLLAGPAGIRAAAEELHRALDGVTVLDLKIHTNGVLLSERFCDLFDELGITVGVSLDGDKQANDRHRRYADGRSSHAKVLKAVELLNRPRYRHLFAGLLCTVDVENDPVAVYDALVALDPPRIDFLLPHATWDAPPPHPGASPTPYADWLDTIYARWDAAGRPVGIRMFESLQRTLRGESSLIESLGLTPADLVVVETDGTFEQADSLKTAYDGAPVTGMDVFHHTLDEVLDHPGMAARRQTVDDLSAACRACPVVTSCGGGLYAHRYRTGDTPEDTGFDNPSVFCPDLKALVHAVEDRETERIRRDDAWPSATAEDLAAFDDLAAGHGSADTLDELAHAQQLAMADLLAALRQRTDLGVETDPPARAAWELLDALDTEAPDALDTVLAHPWTRSWGTALLLGGGAGSIVTAGLAELAAAASLLARRPDPVTVPLRSTPRGGLLRLPGLGVVHLTCTTGTAEVTAHDEEFTVRAGGRELRIGWGEGIDSPSPLWHPVRLVELPGWTVALEDTDPLRTAWGSTVADRLAPSAAKDWAEDLAAAWDVIDSRVPAFAPALAAGLRSITPLERRDGHPASLSSRDAVGAVGIALPESPEALALLLVSEFQRVKFRALQDSCTLAAPVAVHLLGPIEDAYAQLAEAAFGPMADRAPSAPSGFTTPAGLSALGERFVRGMRGKAAHS